MSKSYSHGERKANGKGDADFRRIRKTARRQEIQRGGEK
jgi:hypothetical protein